jgi:RimJ/RimL family protein N-acetyltransferase
LRGDPPITDVFPFEQRHAAQIVALWRLLHPDWTWLGDLHEQHRIFQPSDAADRIGCVIQRQNVTIASVFGTCSRDKTWPRTRFIQIEARPEDMAVEWLDNALTFFKDADRSQPDTWHVINATKILFPIFAPLLEAAGFFYHSSVIQMEFSGESASVADPSPTRLERYAGGNPEIDRAIVDLHNRSYRPARLVPRAELERLWDPWPGLEVREFVLAVENDRLVGHVEWFVTDGEPYVNSLVVARSHWGTAVASALLVKAVQSLCDLGHRKIGSDIRSNNAASMRLVRRLGWKAISQRLHTFVRKL